jgi:branched-subunit amino acid transport protein AzlD
MSIQCFTLLKTRPHLILIIVLLILYTLRNNVFLKTLNGFSKLKNLLKVLCKTLFTKKLLRRVFHAL